MTAHLRGVSFKFRHYRVLASCPLRVSQISSVSKVPRREGLLSLRGMEPMEAVSSTPFPQLSVTILYQDLDAVKHILAPN